MRTPKKDAFFIWKCRKFCYIMQYDQQNSGGIQNKPVERLENQK